MLNVNEIKEKLLIKDDDEWKNRYFFPSTRSGFVIPSKNLKRESIIRDSGEWIIIKTKIHVKIPKNSPHYYKRFWDNLFDWESLGLLDKRNDRFIDFAKEWNRNGALNLLEKNKGDNIVHPQDLDGYDDLPPEDRIFLRILFIYNKIPDKEEMTKDLMLIDGVGKQRAEKFIENGIFLYEDLLKNSNYNIFTFKINRNHILEFKTLFDIAHETIYREKNKIDMTVAGSMGRGRQVGHDIDLLFHEKNKKKVLEIMNELTYQIINKDKNYNLILVDTFVRIDISFYNDIDRVTQFFHYFGPKEMNIVMRKKANIAGYSLNQYGLTREGVIYHPKSDLDLFSKIGINEDPRKNYWKND